MFYHSWSLSATQSISFNSLLHFHCPASTSQVSAFQVWQTIWCLFSALFWGPSWNFECICDHKKKQKTYVTCVWKFTVHLKKLLLTSCCAQMTVLCQVCSKWVRVLPPTSNYFLSHQVYRKVPVWLSKTGCESTSQKAIKRKRLGETLNHVQIKVGE